MKVDEGARLKVAKEIGRAVSPRPYRNPSREGPRYQSARA